MSTEDFIKNNSSGIFTYKEFKFFFDDILNKMYKIKSKKLFLSATDINNLDLLLEEAKSYRDLFYYYNKRNFYDKIKISIFIFLLHLELNCAELYD